MTCAGCLTREQIIAAIVKTAPTKRAALGAVVRVVLTREFWVTPDGLIKAYPGETVDVSPEEADTMRKEGRAL